MRIEIVIYIYGAVCVSMVIFNILYNLVLLNGEKRMERKTDQYYREIEMQIQRIIKGEDIDFSHKKMLERKLAHAGGTMAFDRAMEKILEVKRDVGMKYLDQIQPVFLELMLKYHRKDSMQKAYFAFILSKYKVRKRMAVDAVSDIMLEYIKKENLYCRVNAFSALYAFGHPFYIAKAVRVQDERKEFFNEKILTEGLMSFSDEPSALISVLWDEVEKFSDKTQLAVINYVRFQSGNYGSEMLQIASDISKGKEVRLAAMRYFGKYYYYPAKMFLLEVLANCKSEDWEYAVVSASALKNYRDPDVTEALKRSLYSSNWFIRRNAAESLIAHHPPFKELTDIINGSDRYAREILMYQLESEELKEKGR